MTEIYNECFREFIKERREKLGIPREKLCNGLCSSKTFERFEKGQVNVSKNMQDQFIGRLGVSSDDFISLLGKQEYEEWEKRAEIIYDIRTGKNDEASAKLETYFAEYGEEPLDLQFYYRFKAMLMQCREEPRDEIYQYLKKAKQITMPHVKAENISDYVLSLQEMDTLLDYYQYDEKTQSEDVLLLLEYIRQDRYDNGAKGRLLPKAVFYYAEKLDTEKGLENQIVANLVAIQEICHEALERLRDIEYLPYLYEILELRQRIFRILGIQNEEEKQNTEWLETVIWLYEYFNQEKRTTEMAILYFSKNTECINDVIRTRRKMLGLTKVELSERSCVDIRTIDKIESGGGKFQIVKAQDLLEVLRVPRELTKSNFDISSQEEKSLMLELKNAINDWQFRKAKEIYAKVCERMKYTSLYNEQEIRNYEALIKFYTKEITNEEYVEKMRKVIEMTIPIDSINKPEQPYFTQNELMMLTNYFKAISDDDSRKSDGFRKLEKYFRTILGGCQEINHWNNLAMTLDMLGNWYGNIGEFKKADELCYEMIRGCFRNLKFRKIPGMVYDLWWNEKQQKNATDKNYQLHHCKILAQLSRKTKDEQFYADRIAEEK